MRTVSRGICVNGYPLIKPYELHCVMLEASQRP